MSDWTKKKKGWSTIWTHPLLKNAIVDTNNFGFDPHISYQNLRFDTVQKAKEYALHGLDREKAST